MTEQKEKMVLVPIVCIKCHGMYSYPMLEKYSHKRQTCIYGQTCNTCLTPDEMNDLAERLGANVSELVLTRKQVI